LLDLPAAASYLGLSPWTVRELEQNGTLCRVRLGELRKLLFDVRDLDRFIECSKERGGSRSTYE
jgi:excisionase family DNA binding protein